MIAADILPTDGYEGSLVGRVWDPRVQGPSVVAIRPEGVVDLSATFPTTAHLFDAADAAASLAATDGPVLGTLDAILANTWQAPRDSGLPHFLSPIDVQAVKAAGVTFAVSLIERVIEERALGDADLALSIRDEIDRELGVDLAGLTPGSPEAARLKAYLIDRDLWSQYLEVGIGPDAEIFTKAQVLSTIGPASDVGVLARSQWNNPEPEVVLVLDAQGRVVGAALGNDVNLRDIEGRSALLLGKAKDNNASAAVGPFVRLFDDTFDLDAVRSEDVTLRIEGDDGFALEAISPMSGISRDPADLVKQLFGDHHQYPDGAVLYLGTMFAPTDDRDVVGRGFTHHAGDTVRIGSRHLGTLVNRIRSSEACAPWTFGSRALFANLAQRGLL